MYVESVYSYIIHYDFTINLYIHLFFSTVHNHYSSISDPYILQNKLKSEVHRGNKVISLTVDHLRQAFDNMAALSLHI